MKNIKRKEVMQRLNLILNAIDIETLCEVERIVRVYINAKNLKGR